MKAHTEMALRMQGSGIGKKLFEGVLSSIPELQGDKDNYYAYMYGLSQGGAAKDAAEAAYAAYVDGTYDSSKDYWKVLKNGNIVFDGEKDLYDENGILLKHYTGDGGYTASLADLLGITPQMADFIMRNTVHYERYDNKTKTFVDKNNNSAYLNESMQIETSDRFKAAYNFQINYADKVQEKYGGSMISALKDYMAKDFATYVFDTPATPQQLADFWVETSPYYEFAAAYDSYMINNYNSDINKKFTSEEAYTTLRDIANSITQHNYTNSNPAYDAFMNHLNPVVDKRTYITTYAYYQNGKQHGWGYPRGFAVDIATGGVNGAPVYSNTNSFLFNNSINTNNPLYLNTGNEIRLFNNSSVIYGHLMDNSPSTTALKALVQTFQQSHIWRAFLPAGTKIGNVGNTGNVYGQIGPDFGAHLHWEWRKGYQFWSNRSVQ